MKMLFNKVWKLFLLLMVFCSCSSQTNDEIRVALSNSQNPIVPKLEVYLRTSREISSPDGETRKEPYSDSVLLYFSTDTIYKIHYPYFCENGTDYSINNSKDTLSIYGKFGWEYLGMNKAGNHISIFSSLSDNTQFEDVYKSIEMDSIKISSIIKNKVNWTSFQKKWTIEYGNIERISCELKTKLKSGLDLSSENKKYYSFITDSLFYKSTDNKEFKFQFVDGGEWYLHLNHTCTSKNCSPEISFEAL